MPDFGGIDILAYGVVTAIGALLCYLAARFALLAGWMWLTGVLRLLALWLVAAWLGYGAPLYAVIGILLLAIVWVKLRQQLILLMAFEIAVALLLIWHSQTSLLAINIAAVLLIDQCLTRFCLLRFDHRPEAGNLHYGVLLVVGFLGTIALLGHFQRATIGGYLAKHSLLQSLDLVPLGAARFWYQPRMLPSDDLPEGVLPSVYWQARAPATGGNCLLALHGAAAEGSLQGAAQGISRGAARAGVRVYALDHPGFGASPAPRSAGNVDAWNPALQTNLLLQVMRREGCEKIGVLGHSQGVTEALRLVVSGEPLFAGWLLGAGLYADDPAREDYWWNRFHDDRGLDSPALRLDRANWKLVRDFYYLNQDYCADTPLGKSYQGTTPLNYVTFEREHANLEATREQLWNCLSDSGKSREQLTTDHYLDSLRLGGTGRIGQLILLPRSSTTLIAEMLSSFVVDQTSTTLAADPN